MDEEMKEPKICKMWSCYTWGWML